MKTDISRNSLQPDRNYESVRQQQGRILTDADWNEQADLTVRRDTLLARDGIGRSGAPREDGGFHVSPNGSGSDLTISAGRFYLEGLLCENAADVLFTEQADLPGSALPANDGVYLAYLEVRRRGVTWLEDPAIREIALGGIDGSARVQILHQVKLLELADANYTAASIPPEWTTLINADAESSRGRLTARTAADGVSTDPCEIGARGGYTGSDNLLYRVEIHNGGAPGTATYKWSRNNGTIVSEWLALESDGITLTVRGTGRDRETDFQAGKWIEIIDEGLELEGRPGTLARIVAVSGNSLTIDPDSIAHYDVSITSLDINDFNRGVRRLRLWDTISVLAEPAVPEDGEFFELDAGIEVAFDTAASGRLYRSGDYWMIPARVTNRNIEWPMAASGPAALRSENTRHYARLGFLRLTGGTFSEIADARHIFPALSDAVLNYAGGDGQSLLPNATLQEELRVVVAAGREPVPGSTVRFQIVDGAGSLTDASDAGNTGSPVNVIADADGIAAVTWTTGAARDIQQAQATLLDADGNPTKSVVRFRAHKNISTATEHSPAPVPDPDSNDLMDGVETVAQALDTLGEIKVNRAGDVIEGDLEVKGNFTVRGDVIAKETEQVPGDVLLGDQDEDTVTIAGRIQSDHSSGVLEIEDGLRVRSVNALDTPLRVDATIQGVAGRSYRMPLVIDNTANGSTLSNFQIKFTIDTAALIGAGKLRADAGDLLFLDNDELTALPHWIESGVNTATTIVWVRLSTLSGGSTRTIYMYYGNPDAVTSTSADNVFVRRIDGMLAAYNFDEGSGANILDTSGNGYNGTTVGGTTWVPGRFDLALQSGTGDEYVSVPAFNSPASLNDFTVMAWVRIDASAGDGVYVFLDFRGDGSIVDDSFGLEVDINSGVPTVRHFVYYTGVSVYTQYQTVIPDPRGIWTHFVLARRGSDFEAYVNGQRITNDFITGNPYVPPRTEPVSLANPKRLAAAFHAGGGLFGELDDVRVYNSGLSEAEVLDIYNNRSYTTLALPGRDLIRRFAANDPSVTSNPEEALSASEQSVLYIQSGSGNVGVGTDNPTSRLTVGGVIETTAGGIRFPDGSVQTTAGGGGNGAISGGDNLPLGTILAWHKNFDGSIPPLPPGWLECDGQEITDPDSPYVGMNTPDLNNPLDTWNEGGLFLRGGNTSGGTPQQDTFQGHIHRVYPHAGTNEGQYPQNNTGAGGGDNNSPVAEHMSTRPVNDQINGNPRYGMETRPANMAVVWIMKVTLGSFVEPTAGYALFEDRKPSATQGGTAVGNSWNTRDLNTVATNLDGVSLDSNQITLPPGTYRVLATAPNYRADVHRLRLYNLSTNNVALDGQSAFNESGTNNSTIATAAGVISIGSESTFELQHFIQTSWGSNDMGVASGITGLDEIYSQVYITKLIDATGLGGQWEAVSGGINYDRGNVGIDQTSPQAKLHVGGTPGVDGILFPDGSFQSTAAGGSHLPVGTILAWHKSLAGTPQLPDGWVECNGQVLIDPQSIYNGETMPDLNNPKETWNTKGAFLRGDTTSGTFEDDQFEDHTHYLRGRSTGPIFNGPPYYADLGNGFANFEAVYTGVDEVKDGRTGTETRPVNMTVVWIMKVRDTLQVNTGGYAMIYDQKPAGTPGGQPPAGGYVTRDLNMLDTNISGVALSGNQFTLPAGTYQIDAEVPAHRVNITRARLTNITDSTVALFGTNTYADQGAGIGSTTASITGIFEISSPKTFIIEHYIPAPSEAGNMGIASNISEPEIYTRVQLLKLTSPGIAPKQEIGFYAVTDHSSSGSGQAITNYINIYTNVGNAFDGTQFIAPVPGLYSFSIQFISSVFDGSTTDDVYVELRVNGNYRGRARAGESSGQRPNGSLTAVLYLNTGDVVVTEAGADAGATRVLQDLAFSGHKL